MENTSLREIKFCIFHLNEAEELCNILYQRKLVQHKSVDEWAQGAQSAIDYEQVVGVGRTPTVLLKLHGCEKSIKPKDRTTHLVDFTRCLIGTFHFPIQRLKAPQNI